MLNDTNNSKNKDNRENNNRENNNREKDTNKKDTNSKIICHHNFISDDIDLTPERSQRIVYCTKCFITKNEK